MRSYNEIKASVVNKSHKWFEGEWNINLIFERTSDKYTNKFDDWLYICYQAGGKDSVMIIPCTTKPGLYGSALNPITTSDGVKGVAVVVPNQYSSSHRFLDWEDIKVLGASNRPWNFPFFRQIAPLKVWRDFNKDTIIDHVQPQQGIYGINIHVMSQAGVENPNDQVNNWSEGCLGAEDKSYNQILPIVREAVKKYGNVFTLTLLETKDFT